MRDCTYLGICDFACESPVIPFDDSLELTVRNSFQVMFLEKFSQLKSQINFSAKE